MFKLGLVSDKHYVPGQRLPRSTRISHQLLRVAIPPTANDIVLFEHLMSELQLSSGIFRTTFRGRFTALDQQVNRLLAGRFHSGEALHIEDWAASDCLTSKEWASLLAGVFPNASLHTSDLTLYLIEVVNGRESFIIEPDGHLLQVVRPPFVLSCHPPEPWFLPLNRHLMRAAVQRWNAIRPRLDPLPSWSDCDAVPECSRPPYLLRRLSLVHPEAEALRQTSPRFSIRRHSAFDVLPKPCHVIRTMNIFNISYFSRERLREGAETVFRSLLPEGVWILGRTIADAGRQLHAASILVKQGESFRLIERIGAGSEIEAIALSCGTGDGGNL